MFRRTTPPNASTRHRQVTRARRSFVPTRVDQSALEARQVLTTASLLSTGALVITGTSGPDTINIAQSRSQIYTPNGVYSTSVVKYLMVDAQGDDDAISVSSSLPTTLYGGLGANTYPSTSDSATIVDPALTGNWAMSKAIMDKYQAVGGQNNATLGHPAAYEVADSGGRVMRFDGGEIDYSPATGAHEVHSVIYGKLQATTSQTDAFGAPVRSILGLATSDDSATPGGRVSHFQGGDIYYSVTAGTHVVYGAILNELNATATMTDASGTSVRTILGFPTSDELATPGGRVSHFQGGDIFYSTATGAHVVYGSTLSKLNATAAMTDAFGMSVRTILGFPTADEATVAGLGQVAHFQGGDIDSSAATGTHVVYGAILKEWNALVKSSYAAAPGTMAQTAIGLPTSDEVAVADGRVSHFLGGDIYYSGPTGAHAVLGAVRTAYATYGGPAGVLGFPTADEGGASTLTGFAYVQPFLRGGLAYNGLANTTALPAVTKLQALSALIASQLNGVLDATEVAYFHDLANANSYTDPITRNLMHKLIDGDPANATYQGVPVGNLYVGAPAWRVADLERKWFLGFDSPTATWTRTDSNGNKTTFNGGAYQWVGGPLFGANGPVYSDIDQGSVGDCYFLAALAATVARSPSTIQNMFRDNYDGTFSVRFFHNGTPEYVTVDRSLPSGGTYYARTNGGPIWVALAEKAFVQINQSGWLGNTIVGLNSYAAVDGGHTPVALEAINGQTSIGNVIPGNPNAASQIDNLWSTGRALTFYTTGHSYQTLLASSHVYAVVGYNSTTKMYTLFNPWGINGDRETNPYTGQWDFKAGTVTMTTATMLNSFNGDEGSWIGMSASGSTTASIPVATAMAPTTVGKATPVIVPLVGTEVGTTLGVAAADTPAARVGMAHPRTHRAAWSPRV